MSAKPRLFFTVTWLRWLNLLSHFGLISFGWINPQAKDQVVFWFNGLFAKVSESYFVTILVVVHEFRERPDMMTSRIRKFRKCWVTGIWNCLTDYKNEDVINHLNQIITAYTPILLFSGHNKRPSDIRFEGKDLALDGYWSLKECGFLDLSPNIFNLVIYIQVAWSKGIPEVKYHYKITAFFLVEEYYFWNKVG